MPERAPETAITTKSWLVPCAYESDEACSAAMRHITEHMGDHASAVRLHSRALGHVLVARAVDEPASCYVARLDWGEGTPTPLPESACHAVIERCEAARRRTERARDGHDRAARARAGHDGWVREEVALVRALNTAESPWESPGGVSGALCESAEQAFALRELLCSEHLHEIGGSVTAFERVSAAPLVAVVCDDAATEALARRILSSRAGNLGFAPTPDEAWALWGMRLMVEGSPFSVEIDGSMDDLLAASEGSAAMMPHVRVLAPTWNGPCPCGSGRRLNQCCGQ